MWSACDGVDASFCRDKPRLSCRGSLLIAPSGVTLVDEGRHNDKNTTGVQYIARALVCPMPRSRDYASRMWRVTAVPLGAIARTFLVSGQHATTIHAWTRVPARCRIARTH